MGMRACDKAWLLRCYALASRSPDPSTRNGAVVVYDPEDEDPGSNLLGSGFNGFPPGVLPLPHRLAGPKKYSVLAHAEEAAVFDAVRQGHGAYLDRAMMYCCWAACTTCARIIIQSGIKSLVTHSLYEHGARDDWNDDIVLAHAMLGEAGVRVRRVEGRVGAKVLFGGEEIEA